MNKIKFFLLIVVIAGIAFVGGYYIGGTPLENIHLSEKTPIKELKERLVEGGVIDAEPKEIFSLLQATVVSSGEKDIIVSPSAMQDPFQEYFPQSMKVLIAENTEIESLTLKELAIFQEEMQNYIKSGDKDHAAPSQYTKSSIPLSEIRLGNTVTIDANMNIKNKDSFVASKIQVFIN